MQLLHCLGLWLKGLWFKGLWLKGFVAQGLCGSRACDLKAFWLKDYVAQGPVAHGPLAHEPLAQGPCGSKACGWSSLSVPILQFFNNRPKPLYSRQSLGWDHWAGTFWGSLWRSARIGRWKNATSLTQLLKRYIPIYGKTSNAKVSLKWCINKALFLKLHYPLSYKLYD